LDQVTNLGVFKRHTPNTSEQIRAVQHMVSQRAERLLVQSCQITVRSLCIFSQCHFITSRGQNASSRITSYRIGIFNRGHLNDAQHESNHMIEIIRYARPDRYSNAMHSISILRTERWTSRKLVTCRQLTVTQASCDVGQARLLGFLVNQMQDRTDHAL